MGVGVNSLGFAISALTQTQKITDLCGVGSFVVASWACFWYCVRTHLNSGASPNVASLLAKSSFWSSFASLGLISMWGVRLASFLFGRILATGHDDRLNPFYPQTGQGWFEAPSFYPLKLAGFWSLQALWGIFTLLPFSIGISKNLLLDGHRVPLTRSRIALITMSACLAFASFQYEAIADQQKSAFKAIPGNENRFCDVGLFQYSRYPNYFGEISFWSSMFFLNHFASTGNPLSPGGLLGRHKWTVLSPLFVFLLLRYVSGVPLLEKRQQKVYGANPEFIAYKQNTPLLVPSFLTPWQR
eukprot:TRINITY_DN2075_c0_g1_i4.p1 TRINITY_DN2075_c0_g1~~TRINITY_DN2075_c0_g1_i4.p1  ORF type:complete len:310 (-),score=57.45 TRINITY_DN2075_c0_g1_i4:114-1013(-)